MNAQSRRKIEMGTRALEFSRAHPDADAGYAVAAAKLEQLVARANDAATAQRSGIVDVRAASARKGQLRRTMLAVHIAHLAEVGREAAREDHELGKVFRFKPQASTFLAFRTAARTMATEAENNRETLIKHGLAASVLEEFVVLLDQFDAAVTLGNTGRTAMRARSALRSASGASNVNGRMGVAAGGFAVVTGMWVSPIPGLVTALRAGDGRVPAKVWPCERRIHCTMVSVIPERFRGGRGDRRRSSGSPDWRPGTADRSATHRSARPRNRCATRTASSGWRPA